MISETRSRRGSLVSAGPEGMVSMQQAKLLFEDSVQDLKVKMKGKLG